MGEVEGGGGRERREGGAERGGEGEKGGRCRERGGGREGREVQRERGREGRRERREGGAERGGEVLCSFISCVLCCKPFQSCLSVSSCNERNSSMSIYSD